MPAPLFEDFGHNAVPVKDRLINIHVVHTCGTFHINQSNFYVNFAKDYLEYYLCKNSGQVLFTFALLLTFILCAVSYIFSLETAT